MSGEHSVPQRSPKSYIICTAPRSGSTMLCKLLAATKVAGNPGSLFHEPALDAWLEYYGLETADLASRRDALEAVFSAAIARGKGGGDIFGLRMQRGSFDFFMVQLGLRHPDLESDLGRIEAEFGPTLFIHLSRRDRLDQAISRLRAEQTGLWHLKADGTDLERLTPEREDGYDAEAIRTHIADLSQLDQAWERWFRQEAIEPLRVSYEALARNPHATLAEIVTALGLEASLAAGVPPQTKKLADKTSRAWRARFEAETGQAGAYARLSERRVSPRSRRA
ncbi:MAG: Stf0 family sulfotransferase [Pseudomonadota bacterium]